MRFAFKVLLDLTTAVQLIYYHYYKEHKLLDNVKKDIRKKHRLWTRYRETNDKEVEKLYKQMRNKVKLDIKKLIQAEQ